MICKNIEIHNAEYLNENDDGSVSWCRLPQNVYDKLESEVGKNLACCGTGVELRFKMNSDRVIIKMADSVGEGCFHVFRGGVQGAWDDHEVNKHITTEVKEFVIERSQKIEWLKAISEASGDETNPEIVRVIFDRGNIKLFDVIGDVEPPKAEDFPKKTLMCYGSSITHGSNAIDASHTWAALLGRELKCDVKNKGMAGSCHMEHEFINYIAEEGRNNRWDVLTLELGINSLGFDDKKICERSDYSVRTIAEANPDKPIFVISPFYHCGDDFNKDDRAKIWRAVLKETVEKYGFPNVTYINGLDILGDMALMSADFVHPNIYGAAQIAERLSKIIKPIFLKNKDVNGL